MCLGNMKRCLVVFALFSYCSCTILEFLHVPESVTLPNDGTLMASDVPIVINNLMGLSAEKPTAWTAQTSLWQRPEAAVIFVVKTPHHLKLKLPNKQSYKLQDNDVPDFAEVSSALEEAFSDDSSTIFNVNTDIYGNRAEDARRFVEPGKHKNELSAELSAVDAVSNWALNGKSTIRNGVPDVYVFEIDGLISLSTKFDKDSEQMIEAADSLTKLIKKVAGNFVNVYDGNVVVCVVAGSGAKIRRPRAAVAAENTTPTPVQKPPTNYGFYDENYPVIFNIILWTSLTMAVALLFITSGMWFMDPGRDSIIYRMTMTRAKKD